MVTTSLKERITTPSFTERQKEFERRRAQVMLHAKRGLSIKEISYETKIRTEFVGTTLRLNNWEAVYLSPEERKMIMELRKK